MSVTLAKPVNLVKRTVYRMDPETRADFALNHSEMARVNQTARNLHNLRTDRSATLIVDSAF